MESIFISIACFHDMDVINTITDCVEKAKYPARLHFGICLQTDDTEWNLEKLHPNISINRIDWNKAQGPAYARYLCNQLIQTEEYFLQIDCHSRFIPHWDDKLYNCWLEAVEIAAHDRVVLSMFPISIKNFDRIDTYPLNISGKKFKSFSMESIRLTSVCTSNRTPCPTYYLSGAFIFGPTRFIQEIPYDPVLTHSYQSIEQQFYTIRLYTHGWDIYKPSRHVLATHYGRTERTNKLGKPMKPPYNHRRSLMSWDRVLYYYGLKDFNSLPNEVTTDIDKYGVGNVRSIQSYFDLNGVPAWKEKLSLTD